MPYQEPPALPCADKLVFNDLREAEGAAAYVRYAHGSVVRPYECRFCGLWHLSSH